jgi:hypothetical protein
MQIGTPHPPLYFLNGVAFQRRSSMKTIDSIGLFSNAWKIPLRFFQSLSTSRFLVVEAFSRTLHVTRSEERIYGIQPATRKC